MSHVVELDGDSQRRCHLLGTAFDSVLSLAAMER